MHIFWPRYHEFNLKLNSTWARGQGLAIYGETKDKRFLEAAQKAADFYINHPNLPKDKIPYWDFNAEQKGYTKSPFII